MAADASLAAMRAQAQLPAAIEGGQPLPEGLMWLLLTGDVRRLHLNLTLIITFSPTLNLTLSLGLRPHSLLILNVHAYPTALAVSQNPSSLTLF